MFWVKRRDFKLHDSLPNHVKARRDKARLREGIRSVKLAGMEPPPQKAATCGRVRCQLLLIVLPAEPRETFIVTLYNHLDFGTQETN